MATKVKKQHYVPQFYLRQFSSGSGQIYAYDKEAKKQFKARITDIAQERYFYGVPATFEIPDELKKLGLDESTMLEYILQLYDGQCATIFNQIIKNICTSRFISKNGDFLFNLSTDQKLGVSFFAALQELRTKETREKVAQMNQMMLEAFAEFVVKSKLPDFDMSKYKLVVDENCDSILQSQLFLNTEMMEGIARVCTFGRIWRLGVNNTSTPLMISDHPIVKRTYSKDPFCRSTAWLSPFLEVGIPLNPQLIILLYCPLIFRDRFKYGAEWTMNNKVIELSDENVLYFNSLQCSHGYKYLYSNVDDWSMVERYLSDFPHHGKPIRHKVEVLGLDGNRNLPDHWRKEKFGVTVSSNKN